MMNNVTYADLRFTDAIPMKAKEEGSTLEDHDEDNDIMYENVSSVQPARENRPPPEPATGRGHQLTAGLQKFSQQLSLVFLLLCLILSAGVIGLTIKYVQMSSEFQKLVTEHQTMNRSLAQSLRSGKDVLESVRKQLADTKTELEKVRQDNKELNSTLQSNEDRMEQLNKDLVKTKSDLENTQEYLEKTQQDLDKTVQKNTELNNNLSQCQEEERESTAQRQISEEQLKDIGSKLNKCRCNQGEWIFYINRYFWFSKDEKDWWDSKEECEKKNSRLIIVQKDDEDLKKFLEEQKGTFWVGQVWNNRKEEWEWPEGYSSYYTSDQPWKISYGYLTNYNYNKQKFRWICEKNIV